MPTIEELEDNLIELIDEFTEELPVDPDDILEEMIDNIIPTNDSEILKLALDHLPLANTEPEFFVDGDYTAINAIKGNLWNHLWSIGTKYLNALKE